MLQGLRVFTEAFSALPKPHFATVVFGVVMIWLLQEQVYQMLCARNEGANPWRWLPNFLQEKWDKHRLLQSCKKEVQQRRKSEQVSHKQHLNTLGTRLPS